ncbi:MAG: polyprenyl synthetase family protein [Acidimicrobiia bacterium]|nr:polyprenyl synthetase family protein [Acidimicrobiia bacterium]
MEQPDLQSLVPVDAVWDRLGDVETRLQQVTESDDSFLTKIARHGLDAGGKRYRPLLAQVGAELGPNPGAKAVEAGVAVELVHQGSLYHDDVIDEADARRGSPSINANWSNTVAILSGDFLLARASEVAAPLGQEAVTLIAQTYATLVEGQVLELQLSGDVNHGPAEYFKVIGGKSASLIRTSARLGALSADAGEASVEAVSDWAWEMGMVFQMTDDVLDLVATDEFLGKPAGSDIGEGTYTLPVIYAIAESTEVRSILSETPDAAGIKEVIELVRSGGFVDRVLDESKARLGVSEEAIDRLPDGPMPAVLRGLGRFLLDRVEAVR